jgi:hypothetical protein
VLERLRRNYPSARHWVGYTVALIVVVNVTLALGLPAAAKTAIVVAAAAGFLAIEAANAMLVAFALLISAVALEIGLRAVGLDRAMYYRPHEMLARDFAPWGKHYRPNSAVTMHQPFGDIHAMTGVGILEPREIEFVTDSLGFRNRRDRQGERWVLVGDSFVAGEGNTQACTLGEVLATRHGISAYNVSHPGDDFAHYAIKLREFRRHAGDGFRALVFLFEGNDFGPYETIVHRADTPFRRYRRLLRESTLYRVTAWLSARAAARHGTPTPLVLDAQGGAIAFLPASVEVVRRQAPHTEAAMQWVGVLRELKPVIERLYFIPEKYRVMQPALAPAEQLPNRQWEYLREAAAAAGIPAVDLTPALQAAERELAARGEHTFWRGDTHWNCAGTAAAAGVVARDLQPAPGTR